MVMASEWAPAETQEQGSGNPQKYKQSRRLRDPKHSNRINPTPSSPVGFAADSQRPARFVGMRTAVQLHDRSCKALGVRIAWLERFKFADRAGVSGGMV